MRSAALLSRPPSAIVQWARWAEPPALTSTEYQSPACGEPAAEPKEIGAPSVPWALRSPSMAIDVPVEKRTVTPGSTVSVTPAATVTAPSTRYGLPATDHVVF